MTRAADRAYDEIRSLILSGDAPPGSQLTEEHLAELCGVSRTPVRDALRRLEAELYVVRSDSQRAFVASWSLEEVEEIFALRGMLEAHAAGRAARRLTSAAIATLRTINAELREAVMGETPDIPAFLDANRAFHTLIIEAAQSPRLAANLATLVEQPIVRRTAKQYGREQLERSMREHDELIQAFVVRDAAWAEAVMTAHIRRAYHAFSEAAPRLRVLE